MKKFMTWFNKQSLKYQIRGWIVVVTGIIQMIHWIVTAILTEIIFFAIGAPIIGVVTLWSIKDKFEKVRSDPVLNQVLYLGITWCVLYHTISWVSFVIVVFCEIVIITGGILKIYKNNIYRK